MTRSILIAGFLLGTSLVGACGSRHTDSVSVGSGGSFFMRDGKVVLTRKIGPEAEITADGGFLVDGKPQAVTDSQRAALVAYHASAYQLVEHAKDTGKAGAAVGVAVVSEVVKGISSGDTSQIGPKVEAKAEEAKREARKICDDMAELSRLQATLAADLEAFRPYASIKAREVADCHKDLAEAKTGP